MDHKQILELPGAKYLIELAKLVRPEELFYSTAQWMLTGNGTIKNQSITNIILKVLISVPNNELNSIGSIIFEDIKKRSDLKEILRKAEVAKVVSKITCRRNGLPDFLFTGKGHPGIDGICDWIIDPTKSINEISGKLDRWMIDDLGGKDKLVDTLEGYQRRYPEDVKLIYNYFFPSPVAPEAPCVVIG